MDVLKELATDEDIVEILWSKSSIVYCGLVSGMASEVLLVLRIPNFSWTVKTFWVAVYALFSFVDYLRYLCYLNYFSYFCSTFFLDHFENIGICGYIRVFAPFGGILGIFKLKFLSICYTEVFLCISFAVCICLSFGIVTTCTCIGIGIMALYCHFFLFWL